MLTFFDKSEKTKKLKSIKFSRLPLYPPPNKLFKGKTIIFNTLEKSPHLPLKFLDEKILTESDNIILMPSLKLFQLPLQTYNQENLFFNHFSVS